VERKLRICNKCSKIHYPIFIGEAIRRVTQYMDLMESLPENERSKPRHLDYYSHCSNCGNIFRDFSDTTDFVKEPLNAILVLEEFSRV